jgi:hypothetical protein
MLVFVIKQQHKLLVRVLTEELLLFPLHRLTKPFNASGLVMSAQAKEFLFVTHQQQKPLVRVLIEQLPQPLNALGMDLFVELMVLLVLQPQVALLVALLVMLKVVTVVTKEVRYAATPVTTASLDSIAMWQILDVSLHNLKINR